jgi:hypothetical protein
MPAQQLVVLDLDLIRILENHLRQLLKEQHLMQVLKLKCQRQM